MKLSLNLKDKDKLLSENDVANLWKDARSQLPDNNWRGTLDIGYGSVDIDLSYFFKDDKGEGLNAKNFSDPDFYDHVDIADLEKFSAHLNSLDILGVASAKPQLASLIASLKNPDSKPAGQLKNIPSLFADFIRKHRANYPDERRADFIYGNSYTPNKFVRLTTCTYSAGSQGTESSVRLGYEYYTLADGVKIVFKKESNTVLFGKEDARQYTIQQMIWASGFREIDQDMLDLKYAQEAKALDLLKNQVYEQLVVQEDAAFKAAKDNQGWWGYRSQGANEELDAGRSVMEGGGRVILDILDKNNSPISRDLYQGTKFPSVTKGLLVCNIPVFHLEHNTHMNMDAMTLAPYVYNPAIADEIVLDDDTRVLLDTLTDFSGQDEGYDDIVAGKRSATAVLLMGPPGVGKTLTGQVYSEKIERPLYTLSSGRLGTTPESITKNLRIICGRANRWRCPIQLDEVDAFIRARGFDINQNAIVISFLETLEYSEVTVFMTTNRGFEIDDAIFSRCAAIVQYDLPNAEQRARLWTILPKHFFPKLAAQDDLKRLANDLAIAFEGISGRDIKMTLNLARRYDRSTKKADPWTVADFKRLVKFRSNPNNTLSERDKLNRQLAAHDLSMKGKS